MGQRAEAKISVIYVYFVIFLLIIKTQEAVFLSERDPYRDAVNGYFLCEAVGYVPGKCSRETFEQYSHPALNISENIISSFIPSVMLLYLFDCRALKAKVKESKVIRTLWSVYSRRSAISSNISNTTPKA